MLRKQYFDAVAPDGTWWIAYRAEFRLWGARLRYEELTGSRRARPWWRLATGAPPSVDRFGSPAGWAEWQAAPPTKPPELETETLHWRLVGLGGGFTAGPAPAVACETYVEDLRLKVGPWALGLRTLWWGRVATDGLFVTWIVADGPKPICFAVVDDQIFRDGVTFHGATLSTPAGDLLLGAPLQTISAGDVRRGRSALLQLASRLVFGAGAIRQEKASRRCVFWPAGGSLRHAVAIAETVTFDA